MALARKEINLGVPYKWGLIYHLNISHVLDDCAPCTETAIASRRYADVPLDANSRTMSS
jgi:hypothetical protein